eukprot:TRINITY_DN7902_c2_g1_i1.p1 TRINITY_DN7902_c2_g1~~TRINITY_DN7902_c2_g1_i1.p1  ORF type:complete len:362 (-),score=68.65 TRINITY_DN7902_c2_g1_i1:57-1142(-)
MKEPSVSGAAPLNEQQEHEPFGALVVAPPVVVDKEVVEMMKKKREGGFELARVGDFLPKYPVRRNESTAKPAGWVASVWLLVSGKFLQMGDVAFGVSGARQSAFDENVNMAILSALLLTLMMPMALDNSGDIFEEKYQNSGTDFADSFFANAVGEEMAESLIVLFTDIGGVALWLSTVGFMFSTLSCVYILLCVNEIGTDEGVSNFLSCMGFALRVPYLFFTLGHFWAVPVILRMVCTLKTWIGLLVLMAILIPCVLVLLGISMVRTVRCAINSVSFLHAYEPLILTPEEVRADVNMYFEQAGSSACVDECLDMMQSLAPNKAVVPLAPLSMSIVKVAFHQRMSSLMGLSLSDETLYALAK